MTATFVVITDSDWAEVRTALFTEDGTENAGVLLCGLSRGNSEHRLLVRRFMAVPPELYVTRNNYHLEISPQFYNQIIDECLRQHLSPVIIHSHPGQTHAWYSGSDDYGEERLLPVLQSLLPEALPASLVVTPGAATGRSRSGDAFVPLSGLKILGQHSQILNFAEPALPHISDVFDRQARAISVSGQARLQSLKIGVVGVGGTGSLVVEQLARVGVRDMVLIDPDVIEQSNISRLFGAKLSDVGKEKVNVAAHNASELGADPIVPIFDTATSQEILLALRDRDVVFSCVDNDKSRAVLNRFSYQYLVPVVDMGIRLDGRKGTIRSAAGRVVIVGSGMSCLRCSHHLSPERIRAESLSRQERMALAQEGYIMGIDTPTPAVVSLNTVVCGLGVTAALNMFVRLTGGTQPVEQLYDATSGSVFTATDVHEDGCDVCDAVSGVKGLGDLQIVSAYD